MKKQLIRKGMGLGLLGMLIASSGCSDQDAQCLARVGERMKVKLEVLTAGTQNKLVAGWQAARGDLDEMALDARVSARLRWDKSLTNHAIQVRAEGGMVELRGTVTDLQQRQRAVELARTTVGVETVSDELTVAGKEE